MGATNCQINWASREYTLHVNSVNLTRRSFELEELQTAAHIPSSQKEASTSKQFPPQGDLKRHMYGFKMKIILHMDGGQQSIHLTTKATTGESLLRLSGGFQRKATPTFPPISYLNPLQYVKEDHSQNLPQSKFGFQRTNPHQVLHTPKNLNAKTLTKVNVTGVNNLLEAPQAPSALQSPLLHKRLLKIRNHQHNPGGSQKPYFKLKAIIWGTHLYGFPNKRQPQL